MMRLTSLCSAKAALPFGAVGTGYPRQVAAVGFDDWIDMTGKEEKLLSAAVDCIARYGIRKTSVSDIAKAAGVSRQTVYNAFANKREIVEGAIHFHAARLRNEARQALVGANSLGDKLDALFEAFSVGGFKLLTSSPDAHDIVSGSRTLAAGALAEEIEENRKMYEEVLKPYKKALKSSKVTPGQLAEMVERSARGFCRDAETLGHLRKLLSTLRMVVLRIAEAEK